MKAELKIRSYTPEEIAHIVGGTLVFLGDKTDFTVCHVCTDSREAQEGSLFAAIPGERVDGHDYMDEAFRRGAVCFLAKRVPTDMEGVRCAVILCDDPIHALTELASHYRDQSAVRVIAITGSVGKTTTKEFVAAVVSTQYKTHKTEGNHNNDLGLSMTLFTLAPEDEVSVLEMGMSDFGEIARLSAIARPDIALITNIGTSHMASLGSRENISKAKMEITAGLKKDGVLILNGDEPLLENAGVGRASAPLFVSINTPKGAYRATNIRTCTDGVEYDLLTKDRVLTNVTIPTLGRHNVYNSLFAYAVGSVLGIREDSIRRGLMQFEGADMRQKIYSLGEITVIEDCYNASPESMRAALDVLSTLSQKENRLSAALLGDMLELGAYSRLFHDQLGQYAAQTKVTKLFCYGRMADVVAEAAIRNGMRAEHVHVSLNADDPETMADMIEGAIAPGDILLVKASRGIAAERVLNVLKERRK